jgi:hypothetical protein
LLSAAAQHSQDNISQQRQQLLPHTFPLAQFSTTLTSVSIRA